MTRGRERDPSPRKILSDRLGASLLNAGVTAGRFVSPGQADAPASSVPAAGPSVSFAPSTASGSADDPAGESPRGRARGRSRGPSRSAVGRAKSRVRGVSADSEAQTEGSVYFEELSVEDELMQTANGLARPGTGILAADETVAVLGKRFAAVGLENTPEMRRAYREMLYSAPDLETYTSGIVMYSETVHQSTASDVNFVEMLNARGILVGVKLDRGLHPFGNGEMVTEGLDGLDSRASAAYAAGIRFAKWRSLLVIDFDQGTPSSLAVEENANALAKFAAACQQRRLVPVIEPEVYIAGTHDLEQAATVAEEVLSVVYRALARHGVLLEGTLLQLQMVLPGLDHPEFRTVTPEAIAQATLRTLRRVVPAAVPGVVFLSGGQSEVQATTNLNAINKAAEAATRESGTPVAPWAMSFAFGRVLQASALTLWSNDPTNSSASAKAAKSMVGALLKANCEASRGCYRGPHPSKQSAAIFEALTESRAERVDHELTPRSEASSRAPSRPTSRPPSRPSSRPSSPGRR